MAKKVRVFAHNEIPVKFPIHGTVTAFLLVQYLEQTLTRDMYIIASTIIAIVFAFLWLGTIFRMFQEERTPILNEEE